MQSVPAFIGIFCATAGANLVMGVIAWWWNRGMLAREEAEVELAGSAMAGR